MTGGNVLFRGNFRSIVYMAICEVHHQEYASERFVSKLGRVISVLERVLRDMGSR